MPADRSPSLRLASPLGPKQINIGPVEQCGTEGAVRQFKDTLHVRYEEESGSALSEVKLNPLNTIPHEARLLTLHPTDDVSEHVRCDFETFRLTDLPSFVAIENARGYRKFQELVEVEGRFLFISCALERFLRYLRTKIKTPTRIWVRYACVVEFEPQEQATYWTREFSDRMYALATQVFDMHQINSRLIENGYFEKIVDAKFAEWEKKWCGTPDQVILPRICPVRLDTHPNIDEPTTGYEYMPLDMVADEIRIMCIMPAEDIAAPIVMHAAHCPIKCEVTYIALSYRWGIEPSPERVVLNGQQKVIRKNLGEAIRAIRMTDRIVPLWIDALSINQDDVAERNRQVRRMGEIYDNAMSVYSYVGPSFTDTEQALGFVKELITHPVVPLNGRGDFHFGEYNGIGCDDNRIKPDQLATLCAALYRFLTREYFRRAWILQEVAWASNPIIIAGRGLNTHFKDLDMAAYHLHDMLTRDSKLAGQMLVVDTSLEEVDMDMLAYPRIVFYFRYVLSGDGDNPLPFYTSKPNSPGFLETLVLARGFECIDPRDHIFALWNIPRDKAGLEFTPEYVQPYEEVYVEFAKAWIVQHQALDILGTVESTQDSRDFYHSAPSWCPNWKLKATASCLVRKDYLPTRFMSAVQNQDGKLYRTDGHSVDDAFDRPLILFEDHELHCTGLVLDEIVYFFDEPPRIPAGTGSSRCDPDSNWQFRCFITTVESSHQHLGITAYEDPVRAAWAMLHGDSIDAWPPAAESGYEPGTRHPDERYVCLPHLSRHVPRFADSYSSTEAFSAVKRVLRGRRPFISKGGYMGLAPAYLAEFEKHVKKPCQLAVVAGCSVPLLLQEKENGTYQLIGTCFVQGWMDGEWIETMMGAENSNEFWAALGDGAKLTIS